MAGLSEELVRELIEKAIEAMSRAYTPYSRHKVGAALLTADGTVYTGCNIENVAFTPTNCAERTAFFKAVSEGCRDFAAIAVVGGPDGILSEECPPCGVCRQVMMEFCDPETFQIITASGPDAWHIRSLKEYLPMGFGPDRL